MGSCRFLHAAGMVSFVKSSMSSNSKPGAMASVKKQYGCSPLKFAYPPYTSVMWKLEISPFLIVTTAL